MTIGLDPSTGLDRWWIYDFFPAALAADRARYPATKRLRELLAAAGFLDAHTSIAEHMLAERTFETAERPILRADLRLYATIGHLADEADGARLEA